MAQKHSNPRNVFINCRFDPDWNANFEALVFAVIACGFKARCAKELIDAAGTRIDKLYNIIAESKFGIHDLSCVQLDADSGLPRFNMPLELGFFLAAKQFGGVKHKSKHCIIFESEAYRYQQFISDLNGMDIEAHGNDPLVMIEKVQGFLRSASDRKTIPTARNVRLSYQSFLAARPELLAAADLGHNDLAYADFEQLAIEWVRNDDRLGSQAG
ncbi:MAG: hypothetical protein HC850_07130 [Rhodomicrobium sp.]|nr:hypothetical protein [Rhodomicrobium sp.]